MSPFEIDFEVSKMSEIKEMIEGLKTTESPIILRQGAKGNFDKTNWANFLKNECGLQLDRRHYQVAGESAVSDWWEVSNQADKEVSYTHSKTEQPFHTDNAWFSDPAELLFFIMEKQAPKGGEQFIYSLSKLLYDLRKEDSPLLEDLLKTEVVIKKGNDKYYNRTTIITDNDARHKIYWNYYRIVKDSDEIISLCERFFVFLQNKINSSSVIKIHLNSGDCLVMNDLHVLHGRTSFEASYDRERILLQSMWKIK